MWVFTSGRHGLHDLGQGVSTGLEYVELQQRCNCIFSFISIGEVDFLEIGSALGMKSESKKKSIKDGYSKGDSHQLSHLRITKMKWTINIIRHIIYIE